MAGSTGISGPGADESRAQLQELLSRGPGGAEALAAGTPPGNQYVKVSDWKGSSKNGTMLASAIVAPSDKSVHLVVAAMLVADSNKGFGAGGFFTVLDGGVGAVVAGAGSGSGAFNAALAGLVVVNDKTQAFAFLHPFPA